MQRYNKLGRKAIDLTGQRFGRLTVVQRSNYPHSQTNGQALWDCLCDCGRSHMVFSGQLRTGRTKSCGCLRADKARTLINRNNRHVHASI